MPQSCDCNLRTSSWLQPNEINGGASSTIARYGHVTSCLMTSCDSLNHGNGSEVVSLLQSSDVLLSGGITGLNCGCSVRTTCFRNTAKWCQVCYDSAEVKSKTHWLFQVLAKKIKIKKNL